MLNLYGKQIKDALEGLLTFIFWVQNKIFKLFDFIYFLRYYCSLRVQNVPVKIEVFTTATQGRKDKIGYLLLSLLGAQPCPSNKVVDVSNNYIL